MSTVTSQAPSLSSSSQKRDELDVEPDKAWKDALKQEIEDGLKSMVQDAKKNLSDELAKAPVSVEERERLTAEYHQAMSNIRAIATEAFRDQLERERQERRWAAGQPLLPQWNEALKKEQQDIMDAIKIASQKQKEAASSNSQTANPPPSDARPPEAPPPVPPPPAIPTGPVPMDLPPALAEKEEERRRERERGPPPGPHVSTRRGSNTHSSSPKDDFTHPHATYRRMPHMPPPLLESPKPLEPVMSDDSDVDDEVMLRPPERQEPIRKPSIHERPIDLPTNRSIDSVSRSSSGRYVARSPPKPIPQIWMPSKSPEDDTLTSRAQSGLTRRGSTASIRSTGSAGIRPSIAAPIPERVEPESTVRERARVQDADQGWTPTQRTREKEKQGPSMRNESRYSSASDISQRYEEPASYPSPRTPLRSDANGPVSSNRRPINRKTSFNSDDPEFHPAQQRSVRSRGSFNNDDRGYPHPGGPPSSRPIPRTSSTVNDERERERFYEPPYPRPYPTPPSSASRSTGREYSYGPEAYESYHQEPKSATWRAAQLPESPPKRRTSESRQGLAREPSFTKYSARKVEDIEFPQDVYTPHFDSPPTASIPIVRPKQSPSIDSPGWKSWGPEPPLMRRDSLRDYDYYPRDYDDADRGHDYHGRESDFVGRDYEYHQRSRDHGPQYAPPDASGPSRRERHSVRSPPSSYQGNQYDRTNHQFGGREARHTVEEDSEEYSDESEQEQEEPPYARRQPDVTPLYGEQTKRKELEQDAKRKARGEQDRNAKEEARRIEQEKAKRAEELERKREWEEEEEEEKAREEEAKREKERKEKDREEEEERARQLAAAEEEKRQQEAEEAIQKAAEARRLSREAKKKAAEARKLEEEAKKLEAEAKKRAEEVERTQEEYRKKEQDIKRKEEETRKKAEQLRKQELEATKKEREVKKKEQDAKLKEQEAKRKEEEAKRKEEEAQKREEEAQQKEEETKRKEELIRQREEDLKKREDELNRREEEISRTAAEKLQKEWEQEEQDRKSREAAAEMKRLEQERRRHADEVFRKDQERIRQDQLQQEEFRKREEEIRRRAEERKRQDSVGAESSWGPSSYSSQPSSSPSSRPLPHAPAPNAAEKPAHGASPSSWNSNGPSPWASQARSTSTSSTAGQTASSTSKPRSGSMGSTLPTNPSPNPPPPRDENEWRRRQEEQFIRQQEQFRREQERLEAARQAKEAGKILTKEDVIAVYERHERLWQDVIPKEDELRWRQFPWPMFKAPSSPEDITFAAINAYMQSPHYPEKDKARTQKDRLKDQIKRWHPDRFDTKVLPKVIEGERDIVKEGAGSVVRTLNELLTRSNVPSVFS
ncbi:hypothetical protein Hypma_003819 [Hypsizygus marmoreus]|uniref:Uncharacterized protein n=1 Tax=Hypsizygus marmoreus TaxID=39966 RepID=A0A369K4G0_HYPMA|nr:hypothetical protein Hypma_003819 [Hypsizygus marmoreus]